MIEIATRCLGQFQYIRFVLSVGKTTSGVGFSTIELDLVHKIPYLLKSPLYNYLIMVILEKVLLSV